ncbi:MAG: hypothetical protein P4L22_06700 [Candidatus Babeliales bacterium]|nr:hypothetical protein [Candidatus Babeliales bacterium]
MKKLGLIFVIMATLVSFVKLSGMDEYGQDMHIIELKAINSILQEKLSEFESIALNIGNKKIITFALQIMWINKIVKNCYKSKNVQVVQYYHNHFIKVRSTYDDAAKKQTALVSEIQWGQALSELKEEISAKIRQDYAEQAEAVIASSSLLSNKIIHTAAAAPSANSSVSHGNGTISNFNKYVTSGGALLASAGFYLLSKTSACQKDARLALAAKIASGIAAGAGFMQIIR